jgi:hypothetical protein
MVRDGPNGRPGIDTGTGTGTGTTGTVIKMLQLHRACEVVKLKGKGQQPPEPIEVSVQIGIRFKCCRPLLMLALPFYHSHKYSVRITPFALGGQPALVPIRGSGEPCTSFSSRAKPPSPSLHRTRSHTHTHTHINSHLAESQQITTLPAPSSQTGSQLMQQRTRPCISPRKARNPGSRNRVRG